MRRLLAVLGVVTVVVGSALALVANGGAADPAFEDLATLLVLAGAALALWKIGRSIPARDDVALPPWVPGGAIVYGEPERTPSDHPLSAEELSAVIEAAGATAREQGTVEDGLAVLRPPLRDTLLDALVQGGMDREAAEQTLANGTWTTNRWAAYVIEPSVGAPRWTLRQRFRAWLFPEDTVQRLARIAVHGVGRTADEAIPPVPGQAAPRSVPVAVPTLSDLQRGADGELQEAVDPTAIARGASPPDHHALDEGFADSGDDSGESGPEESGGGEAADEMPSTDPGADAGATPQGDASSPAGPTPAPRPEDLSADREVEGR